MGDEADGHRKTYWRSTSWSSSRASSLSDCAAAADRRQQPPLTPRSKARSCLPPLQPLSITRRSFEEWPRAGSDDLGEWPQQASAAGATPRGGGGGGLRLDLSSLRRDRLASFDKECSKVADHIYLGGDSVARSRDILRQNGITHVLNCVGFVCQEYFKAEFVYKTLWLQDSPSEDITSILYDVFDYFEDVRGQGGRVFVHCCQGVSRSTSLVIAYLMWRKGQSFDDAFQFVKAARGIANPNMGFACQLLQCQKRVHAIPLSPNSVLRMYRMAPHSSYDALHLVPKMLPDASPAALDSRGAFIVHFFSLIYVWVGRACQPVMEKDAKAAAFQVVRYERVNGPILIMEEGDEPPEFWEAFSNAPPAPPDPTRKVCKDDIQAAINTCAGKRRVDSYNTDFELFYKAITGGVVPPFSSSSGAEHETNIPARESNWSILRRKFISGAIGRVYSDSVVARDGNACKTRVQLLSSETTASPPYPSPSSLTSDSSRSSGSSRSDSPSLSPSTSSPVLTPPADDTVESHHSHLQSFKPSFPLPSDIVSLKPSLEAAATSPSKGFPSARSIAERRGTFSQLKLPTLAKDICSIDEKRLNSSSSHLDSSYGLLDRKNDGQELNDEDSLNRLWNQDLVSHMKSLGGSLDYSDTGASDNMLNQDFCPPLQHDQSFCGLSRSVDMSLDVSNKIGLSIYRWPSLERMPTVGREDLDSGGVFLFIISGSGREGEAGCMLYIWLGSCFEKADIEGHLSGSTNKETDWVRVGHDFLATMGLLKDVSVKVVKEQDPELQGIISSLS